MNRWGFVVIAALVLGEAASSYADTKSYFVDGEGVPLLTNRPDRYRKDPDFHEVRVDFEPIVVFGVFKDGAAHRYTSGDIQTLVSQFARVYKLDESLIYGVIQAESNFDPNAVSRAGARGLMQLMPGTAEEMHVTDSFDPAQNIAGGTQYLAKLLKLFDYNLDHALAAYNAGPGNVKKYKGIPPFEETRNYVRRVRSFTRAFERGDAAVKLASGTSRPKVAFLPEDHADYVIHFHSGATQPADAVREDGTRYIVKFEGRTYTLRKELVSRVARSA